MTEFAAIVLICLNTVPAEACTEETASDVLSVHADSELGCNFGWQEIVARSPLVDQIGSTAYVKTLCRRAPREDEAR